MEVHTYVLGGLPHLLQVKCGPHIGQWSLFFNDFTLFSFLTAEKIAGPTKMDISERESNRDGAYNNVTP